MIKCYNLVLTSQIQYGTRVLGGLQVAGTHVLVVSWAEMVSWPKSHPNRIFDLVHLLLACNIEETIVRRKDMSSVEMSLYAIYPLALCGQHGLVDSHFTH